MSAPATSDNSDELSSQLGKLKVDISSSEPRPLDPPEVANPWDSQVPTPITKPEVRSLDPSTLDPTITQGFESSIAPTPKPPSHPVPRAILDEFDPIINQVENDARAAWESAPSHPPPPSPPPKSSHDSRPQTPVQQPSSSPFPSFPSLASLARTFNLSPPKQRPVSLDAPIRTSMSTPLPSTPPSISTPPIVEPHIQAHSSSYSPPAFDFQAFLDQMRSKGAEPVAKYLKSFLSNFAKRTFTVNDQIKIINDFLSFISAKMRECDTWSNASDAEFDNAVEGIEKLVMNRLYEFTFTPQLARAIPPRPVTCDDLERDRVLAQRISLFSWIEEKHLDIPEGEGSKGFIMFAQQELLKINHYKAPRDKLICILNCCKVIFGLLRHLKKDESADSFVPILIFIVIKTNPDHLLSNIEFINRFRNPEKLRSEAGYYLSSLMGAVSFVETMDHTSLSNITKEEFEKNVEEAIHALPPSEPQTPASPYESTRPWEQQSQHSGEESAEPLSLPTPVQTLSDDALRLLQKTGDTISKPLNAIGRIFSEAIDNAEGKLSYLPGPFAPLELGRESRQAASSSQQAPHWSHPDQVRQFQPQTPPGPGLQQPIQPPYKPRVRRVDSPSPSVPQGAYETPSRGPSQPLTFLNAMGGRASPIPPHLLEPSAMAGAISRTPTPNLDFASMQREIDQAHAQASAAARETLVQIFPGVDTEVIEWVLEANDGDLGKSIEALLEVSSGA